MSKVLSAAVLAAAFEARYPGAQPGVLESISAAEEGKVNNVQAAGSVRGFAAVSGSLQWIKATENFFHGGELIAVDDFIQILTEDAERLVRSLKAKLSTAEEAAAADAANKKSGKA